MATLSRDKHAGQEYEMPAHLPMVTLFTDALIMELLHLGHVVIVWLIFGFSLEVLPTNFQQAQRTHSCGADNYPEVGIPPHIEA